jgi:hypothetical protein
VPPRLSSAERVRAQIVELFASEQDLGQVLEQIARLSVRLVIQAAVEAEVCEFLGRALGQAPPLGSGEPPAFVPAGRVVRRDRLGGLIHEYAQVA